MIAEGARHLAERLRTEDIAVDDPERTAWLVITAQVSILRAATRERPALLDDPRLADDIERLCMGYLTDR